MFISCNNIYLLIIYHGCLNLFYKSSVIICLRINYVDVHAIAFMGAIQRNYKTGRFMCS